jgi:23S rRNA (uridine2552-2'-O)-methyltransferase
MVRSRHSSSRSKTSSRGGGGGGGRSGLNDVRNRHDAAYLRAKAENYAGRAVYKLKEIDERFHLLKRGQTILDLGCWPGSWLQYAVEKAGDEAVLVGVDLDEVELALPSNVTTYVGDVFKLRPESFVKKFGAFDLVLSDMAPNTTGDRPGDQHGSEELFLRALEIATVVLRPGGHFCAKVFQGPRFPELLNAVRRTFNEGRAYRPANTRTRSIEQYIIGRGKRPTAHDKAVAQAARLGELAPSPNAPVADLPPPGDTSSHPLIGAWVRDDTE